MLEVHQIPCLSDNYGYLIHDTECNLTAAIDTPDVNSINQALKDKGWALTHIFNTHHHGDHVGGNLALKRRWQCIVVGSAADAARIPGIDIKIAEGATYQFGAHQAQILEVSGHTIGHIAYYFAAAQALFCGDALFSLGCGRLFEGTAAQMWHSLSKFILLPDETAVYCAHEYTQANARFALSVEPENLRLQHRAREIARLRAASKPTIPSTLGLEKATNPFLRPDSPNLQQHVGKPGAKLADVFAETRRMKDNF